VHTRANRQPALAVYRRTSDSDVYHAWGIWVLTTDGDAIAEVAAFVDPELVRAFGLPFEIHSDQRAR
jgi:RNA polymerase sigma-70 factor (ECF subfamily)